MPDVGEPPVDAAEVMATHTYLRACHKLFEQGFLSHEKIESMDSHVLQNIQEGFSYFKSWCGELKAKCEWKIQSHCRIRCTNHEQHYPENTISWALCMASVADVGQTLNLHRVNIWCLLGKAPACWVPGWLVAVFWLFFHTFMQLLFGLVIVLETKLLRFFY